jgi:hypothetical protein
MAAILGSVVVWRIVLMIVGSFIIAYLFQIKGRETRTGGAIGVLAAGLGGWIALLLIGVVTYYLIPTDNSAIKVDGRRWYNWWR